MKYLLMIALVAAQSAIAAEAPSALPPFIKEVGFKAGLPPADKFGLPQMFPITYGSVRGKPAHLITLPAYDDASKTPVQAIIVLKAGRAHNWDQASEICRNESPRGQWRLMSNFETSLDLMSGATIAGVTLSTPQGEEENVIYPYWAFYHDDPTAARFVHTALYGGGQTGVGHGEGLLDLNQEVLKASVEVSNAEAAAEATPGKEATQRLLKARQFYAFLKAGLPVFCVIGSVDEAGQGGAAAQGAGD